MPCFKERRVANESPKRRVSDTFIHTMDAVVVLYGSCVTVQSAQDSSNFPVLVPVEYSILDGGAEDQHGRCPPPIQSAAPVRWSLQLHMHDCDGARFMAGRIDGVIMCFCPSGYSTSSTLRGRFAFLLLFGYKYLSIYFFLIDGVAIDQNYADNGFSSLFYFNINRYYGCSLELFNHISPILPSIPEPLC